VTKRATVATLCALAFATAAAASTWDGGRQQVHLTAADNAAARHVVLRKADFGGAPGWRGGTKKPDLSSTGPRCANFHPKYSDLVLSGIAETEFQNGGLYIDDEVQILKSAPMVKLDWQRSVLAPGLLPCLRTYLAKGAPANAKVRGIHELAFPRVAQYTAAYRLVLDVTSAGTTASMLLDLVLVGRGRTEITLTTVAPYAARVPIKAAEERLARLVVSRVRS
jgi:hypothetical protein